MSSFSRYLNYKLEKSRLRTLVFAALSVLFSQAIIRDELAIYYNWQTPRTGLYALAIVLGIFCTIIPILETAEMKNRRNLDTLYFFPIGRAKLALVNYLCGWIQITVIYTATYLFACGIYLTGVPNFALIHLLPYYFFSLLAGLLIYSIVLFLFEQANTVADGVLFCALGVYALYAVFGSLTYVVELLVDSPNHPLAWTLEYIFNSFWGCIYAPLNNLTVLFQNLIEPSQILDKQILKEWYMFVFWGVIGLASAIGFFFCFVRHRTERIGDISDSWFGYRIMIPLYGYALFLGGGISRIIVLILMASGYFIYRRSFKLKKSDIVVLLCSIIPILLDELLSLIPASYPVTFG